MTSTSFETLSLSLSHDAYRGPVKEWPLLGFPSNFGGKLGGGGGGGQEIEHSGMGCRKHPLLETSLYLPVGIVCQDALVDQRGPPLHTPISHDHEISFERDKGLSIIRSRQF